MKTFILLVLSGILSIGTFAQTDTLTSHFQNASDTLYPLFPWGYVSGHNPYNDLSKVQRFDQNYGVPSTGDYEIRSILFWIAQKDPRVTANSFAYGAVWNNANDDKPDTVISNALVQLNVDTSSAGLNYIGDAAYYNAEATFLTPVRIPADRKFWVGLQLTNSNYALHEYVWLKTTYEGTFADTLYAMDEWNNGFGQSMGFFSVMRWANIGGFAYGIFPVIGPASNPNDTTDLSMIQVIVPGSANVGANTSSALEYVVTNTGDVNIPAATSYQVEIDWDIANNVILPTQTSKELAPGESDTNRISGAFVVPDTVGSFGYCVRLNLSGDQRVGNDSLCSTINISKTTGSSNLSQREVNIYPVPANGFLNVSGLVDIDEVIITDINGKMVNSFDLHGEQSLRIDLLDLPSGSYQMTINGEEINKAYQFIKQ